MRFKEELDPTEFFDLHPTVMHIVTYMAFYCHHKHKHIITVSSMIRKRTTDSGVHETGRACDVSPFEYTASGNAVTKKLPQTAISALLKAVQKRFTRKDGKEIIMYHNAGTGYHFHIQVPYDVKFRDNEERNVRGVRKWNG